MQIKRGGSMQYEDMGPHDLGLHVNTRGFAPMHEEGMTYRKLTSLRMDARRAGRLVAPRHEKTLAIIMLNCERCNTEFMKTHSRMRFCSALCQNRDNHKRHRERKRLARANDPRRPSGPVAAINTCGHPDRRHMAKGLCKHCYNLAWTKAKRTRLRAARLSAQAAS